MNLKPYAESILSGKTIEGNLPPEPDDVEIACEAFRGSAIRDIQAHRPGCDMAGVMRSLKRVRDAIRMGNAPLRVAAEFPALVRSQQNGNGIHPVEPIRPKNSAEIQDGAIVKRAENYLAVQDPQKLLERADSMVALAEAEVTPETVGEHFDLVRARGIALIGPLAYRAIALGLIEGNPLAVKVAVDVAGLGPKRGTVVNQQFNIGGKNRGSSQQAHGLRFEQMIARAQREDEERGTITALPAGPEGISGDSDEDDEGE